MEPEILLFQHTDHASVFSHSDSDFECFCKFVNLNCFYLEIPKQANIWLPQSFVPVSAATWKELAGYPSYVGNILPCFSGIPFKMGQKQVYDVQEVVLDISAGQRTDCGVPVYRKGFEMN